jgi:hypothetical protein
VETNITERLEKVNSLNLDINEEIKFDGKEEGIVLESTMFLENPMEEAKETIIKGK